MTGIIVKGIAGFYYVKSEDVVYECKARGIFKKTGEVPCVGDFVRVEEVDEKKKTGIVSEILPRENIFIRPPVANVEQLVIVCALADPEPNMAIIDKFLVMAERSRVDIVVCINKADLVEDAKVQEIKSIYEGIYPVVLVNGNTGMGVDELLRLLAGKRSAFAGPSGVGKSTIINLLQSGFDLETGEIGRKSKRGKHTTRHVEMFDLNVGGMVYDTPGFTSFDVLEAEEAELTFLYPEFQKYLGLCKFDGCRHISEPGCAIKTAVSEGKIHKSRYNSYKSQLEEIRERERQKYQ